MFLEQHEAQKLRAETYASVAIIQSVCTIKVKDGVVVGV